MKFGDWVGLVFLATCPLAAQAPPGAFTPEDSLVVRMLLDTNGRQDIPVDSVVRLDASQRFLALDVDSLGLRMLPPEIGRLQFVYLQANGNRLVTLPPELNDIYPLRIIELGNNLLESLPGPFDRVSEVWMLNLSYNRLTAVTSEDLRRSGLEKVAVLRLDHNKLESVAPNLLEVAFGLNLDNNRLVTLPADFMATAPRGMFRIDSNRLCSISDSMAAWISRYSQNKNWRSTQECGTAAIRISPSRPRRSSACTYSPGFRFAYLLGIRQAEPESGTVRQGRATAFPSCIVPD